MIDEIKLLKEIKDYFKMRIDKTKDDVDCVLDYNKQICNIIDKQARVNQWIPCNEELPKSIGETILITVLNNRGISHCHGSVDIAYARDDEKKVFYGTDGRYSFDEATAWLPEPYKEESE